MGEGVFGEGGCRLFYLPVSFRVCRFQSDIIAPYLIFERIAGNAVRLILRFCADFDFTLFRCLSLRALL